MRDSKATATESRDPPEGLDEQLNALLYDGLRRLLAGLAIFMAVFTVSDFLSVPAEVRVPVVLTDTVESVIFLCGWFLLRRRIISERMAHPMTVLTAWIALCPVLVTYNSLLDSVQAVYVLIIVIGIGSFMLSLRWAAIAILGVMLMAGVFIMPTLPSRDMTQWVLAFMVSSMISLTLLATRRASHVREFQLQHKLRQRNQTLSRALLDSERELTERVSAEEKLRQQRDFSDQLIETAPAIVVLLDSDGHVLRTNRVLCELSGWSSDEVQGCDWFARFMPESAVGDVAQARRHMLASNGGVHHVTAIVTRDGQVRQIDWHSSVLRDDQADGSHALAIGQDITEQRRSEAERAQLQAQLLQAQKMEAIGTLAGGIAHDMNNALMIMSGMAEIVMEQTERDDPRYEDLSVLMDTARRSVSLTRNLLAFGRKGALQRERCSLNEIVVRTAQLLGRTISKRIELRVECQPDLDDIDGDPDQIEQALINLCLNAVDAMQGQGQLRLRTLNEASAGSDNGSGPTRRVRMEVQDSGVGMDAATQTRIFEPFFTTKPPGQGTGLGLSMVYGTVTASGGTVHCSSAPGQGTTFHVTLPSAQQEETSVRTECVASDAIEQIHRTILFVDDEQQIRTLGCRSLGQHGFTVLVAANGQEALDIYRERGDSIDLVVLDMEMPVLDGYQCFCALQELDPEVRTLIISGYAKTGRIEKTLAAGARAYMHKPFKLDQFVATCRQHIR